VEVIDSQTKPKNSGKQAKMEKMEKTRHVNTFSELYIAEL
jgi:hypothetical protein